MTVLSIDDLACLSRADLETRKIKYEDRTVSIDPESILRLADAGLCDQKGNLTDDGFKKVEAIKKRVDDLRNGIAFERRKRTDHLKVRESDGQWLTGTLKNKEYLSDGYFLLFAKPYASMSPKQGSSEFRQTVPRTLSKIYKMKNIVKLEPKVWQMTDLGGIEIIWLCDEEKKTKVAVQGMYFDFTKKKYPKSTFHTTKGEDKAPVQIRVINRGFKDDVVGVIMPMEINKALPIPEF